VARAAQLAAVAALPLAAGITGSAYLDPGEFADGFGVAMVITAGLAALGGLVAAVGIRNPPAPEVVLAPAATGWFCGAEGTPLDTCPGSSAGVGAGPEARTA
jgi:hypothetical protein